MRIVFMGTPPFAVPTLDRMAAEHDVVAVYTQPPRPAGRGKALRRSAVHERADALGIAVRTPARLSAGDVQAAFAALAPDLVVVAAYGLILPQAVLDVPPLGCLNVHASLLPRWRGAAPIQRAILSGDRVSGVTIMAMDAGLDTGAMLAKSELTLGAKNAGQVTAELAELGAELLIATLADRASTPAVPQPAEGVTIAPKIDKIEAQIQFYESAVQVERQIRAFAPAPGAWIEHRGERIRILAAETLLSGSAYPGTVIDEQLTIACNPGALRPTIVQRAGRAVLSADEFLRGWPIPVGTVLG